jgi:S-formylglutathione hydrolase FrmB
MNEHTGPAQPAESPRTPRIQALGAAAVAVVVLVVVQLFHVLDGFDATLVEMGFDADRAALIAALTLGSLVAAAGSLLTGGAVGPVIAGVVVFGVLDATTFWSETTTALAVSGPAGRFDPIGWAVTVATLVLSALAFCWAASHLALAVREGLRPAGRTIRNVSAGRRPTGRATLRVLATGAAILVAVVVVSVFGDLVNFSPDVHMLAGAPPQGGLVGGPSTPPPTPAATSHATGSAGPGSSPTSSAAGSRMVPGPLPGSLVTEGALSSATPWAAHPPTGPSKIVSVSLPAPWTGGSSTAQVDLYLPPGYPEPGVRYPVVYQAPMTLQHWTSSMQLPSVLDSLITSGAIPPQIFVFAGSVGGPYVDSECADSFDGREWFDRYMATTVVPYIDANYPTIPEAAARSLLGYSQGGYCAAALLFRHPDVFGQAVSLTGYYEAGLESPSTPNAWKPFNRDPALIKAFSPLDVVSTIPKDVRSQLFMIITADPNANPYGQQLTSFASALATNGVPAAIFPLTNAHSWSVVRTTLPTVLPMITQRQLKLGVPIGGG